MDVSENNIDKRAAEYLVQAITPPVPTISFPDTTTSSSNSPSLTSETLPTEPTSTISNSTETSEVVEARDEEQETENPFYDGGDDDILGPLFTVAPLLKEDSNLEVGTVLSIRLENCGLKSQALEALG